MAKKLTEPEAIEKINKELDYKNKNLGTDLKLLGFVNDEWIGNTTCLILHCNKHNITWDTTSYNNFMKPKSVCCIKCSKENMIDKQKLTLEEAYNKVIGIHKNDEIKYDYSKIKDTYTKFHENVTVICPIHGDFEIQYSTLLNPNKGKCPKCISNQTKQRNSLSREESVERINKKIKYIKKVFNVDIVFLGFKEEIEKTVDKIEGYITYSHLVLHCNKHNITWDTTEFCNFVNTDGIYCPSCSREGTKSGLEKRCEDSLNRLLDNPKIQTQYHINGIFDTVTNTTRIIIADFYLSDYNTIVEVNGEQHYRYIEKYHKDKGGYQYFNDRVNRDRCLERYCDSKGIHLLKIPWCDFSRVNTKKLDNIIKAYFEEGKDITTKVDPILLPIKYEGEIKNG